MRRERNHVRVWCVKRCGSSVLYLLSAARGRVRANWNGTVNTCSRRSQAKGGSSSPHLSIANRSGYESGSCGDGEGRNALIVRYHRGICPSRCHISSSGCHNGRSAHQRRSLVPGMSISGLWCGLLSVFVIKLLVGFSRACQILDEREQRHAVDGLADDSASHRCERRPLRLGWSNWQTTAQRNRRKALKRQPDGRADQGLGRSTSFPCTPACSTSWWARTTSANGSRSAITGRSRPAARRASRVARSSRNHSGCRFAHARMS